MTVGEFLLCVKDAAGKDPKCRGTEPASAEDRTAGTACTDWTAGEDFGSCTEVLLRKNCARILHRYLQKVAGVKDLSTGLPSYEEVRDIYDCRICAPHISQVLARGIMETETRGSLQLFEGNREVCREEALEYIRRMQMVRQKGEENDI
jgi:hypothetical protein